MKQKVLDAWANTQNSLASFVLDPRDIEGDFGVRSPSLFFKLITRDFNLHWFPGDVHFYHHRNAYAIYSKLHFNLFHNLYKTSFSYLNVINIFHTKKKNLDTRWILYSNPEGPHLWPDRKEVAATDHLIFKIAFLIIWAIRAGY